MTTWWGRGRWLGWVLGCSVASGCFEDSTATETASASTGSTDADSAPDTLDSDDSDRTTGVSASDSDGSTSSTTSGSTTDESTTGPDTSSSSSDGSSGGSTEGTTGGPTGTGTCEDPFSIADGQSAMRDTSGAPDDLSAVTGGTNPCQPQSAGEHVYALVPTQSGALTLTVTSTYDLGLYVRHACDDGATEFACRNGVTGGLDEEVTISVVAGETYYVVVDGSAAGQEGDYTLTVGDVVAEASCTDGLDDNLDVLVDCEDPSCLSDASCSTAIATTCGGASTLTLGGDLAGNTSSGSPDFSSLAPECTGYAGAMANVYAYTAASDAVLRVRLTSASDQGMYFRTECDAPETQVLCHDTEFAGPDEVAFLPVDNGSSYAVFVTAYEPADEGAYTLRADAFPLGESEPNDDYGSADTAVAEQIGHISSQHDEDWFEITVGAASNVVLETEELGTGDCAQSRIDTDLELFMANGTTSVAFDDDIDDVAGNYCSQITANGLSAGTYFVRVRSSEAFCRACLSAYRLTVAITPV